MNSLIKRAAPVAALAWAPLAFAGHGTTYLTIHNTFDGAAELWVDGRYEGAVRGDSTASFVVRPGNRDISVRRSSGYQLLWTKVHLHPNTQAELQVVAPPGVLAMHNPTPDRLWVRVDGKSVPLAPRESTQLTVETGDVDLVVEMRDRNGSYVVDRREVWVEPGAVAQVGLKVDPRPSAPTYGPPQPVPASTSYTVSYTPPPPPRSSSCSMSSPAVAWHDDRDDDDRHGKGRGHD